MIVMEDPFEIVEPRLNTAQIKADTFARGDGWMVTKNGTRCVLSYLAGHFATTEKFIEISEAEAALLKSGDVDFNSFIVAKGVE